MKGAQVLFFFVFFAIICNEVLGYIEVSIRHTDVHVKNDKKHMNIDGLRVKKIRKLHMVTGAVEYFHDFGNDYNFMIEMYKSAGNDYKRMPYKVGPKPWCEVFSEDTFFYEDVKAASDFPEPDVCPWPKKVYHVFNYTIPTESIPSFFSSGDYRTDVLVLKGEEKLQGFSIFINILHMM